ncbi:MAG: hypothetical protein ACE141_03105 [Bryobacteraceae bacterium]
MRRTGSFTLSILLLVAVDAALAADRVTVTKQVNASSGPWAVTLSLNYDYPYGGGYSAPTIFSSADGFAFQPGDVLTVKYDSGMWCGGTTVSVGTCVDANGYRNYPPTNNQPYGTTTIYAPSRYMNPASYPIYLMQLVGTFADARGQIVGTPFKIGNGPVDVTIPPEAVQLQLGANYYGYSDARNFFTPLKASVTGTTMQSVGSMAQVAVGGAWKTTFVLQNTSARPAQARLNFFDNDGRPLQLPLSFPASPALSPVVASTLDRTLEAGAALTIVSSGSESGPTLVGWAQLVSDGSVSGFAIFGSKSGDYDQEAVVPLETRSSASYVLWFDNTDSMVVGVALANLSTQPVTIEATIRDEAGLVIGTGEIPLPALGHTSFELPSRLAQTAQRRGTVEFRTAAAGQISVLGLRFNPLAFTTIPVTAK